MKRPGRVMWPPWKLATAEHQWLQEFYRHRVCDEVGAPKDRVSFTQSKPTYIVRCNACGTVLRDPQPTCEALSRLYASDTYGQDTLEQLAANQREFFRHKAGQVQSYLHPGANILEIGSFAGALLEPPPLTAGTRLGWKLARKPLPSCGGPV